MKTLAVVVAIVAGCGEPQVTEESGEYQALEQDETSPDGSGCDVDWRQKIINEGGDPEDMECTVWTTFVYEDGVASVRCAYKRCFVSLCRHWANYPDEMPKGIVCG